MKKIMKNFYKILVKFTKDIQYITNLNFSKDKIKTLTFARY